MASINVAIVGAGPAGSYLAYRLAQYGIEVLLFDFRAPWDRPCGGGVTGKVIEAIPLLKEFSGFYEVHHLHFISPSGHQCQIEVPEGFFSLSRKELNQFLLGHAQKAGASFIPKKVKEIYWRGGQEVWEIRTEDGEQYLAYHLIGADGANSFVAQKLQLPKPLEAPLTLGVGYHFPYDFERVATIKFLDDLPGFLWVLPHENQSTVGIVATAPLLHGQRLFEKLDQFISQYYELEISDQMRRFVGSIPWYEKFQADRIMGHRWTMIGDAAGWVDMVSKEGIYYSLMSAATLGEAMGVSLPDGDYRPLWKEGLLPMLQQLNAARRWYKRFYRYKKLDKMIERTRGSLSYQKLVIDFLSGRQTYSRLRRR
ncbi:MAG: hypothetical protein A3I75_06730, partial [Deltaproteobacteria bacterium RIFCSPLOWO2_02_FULL_50_16]